MRVIAAIHDVHACNYEQVEFFLNMFSPDLRKKFALMVVPNYKSHAMLCQTPPFRAWLQEKVEQGNEIFAHGLYHMAPEIAVKSVESIPIQYSRNMWGKMVNRFLVDGEAEFCGLKEKQKMEVAKASMSAFAEWNIPVSGIVVPTWYGSLKEKTLNQLRVQWAESRFKIYNLAQKTHKWILPFSFTPDLCPGSFKEKLHNSALKVYGNLLPIFRLALHPPDFENPLLPVILAEAIFLSYREIWQ